MLSTVSGCLLTACRYNYDWYWWFCYVLPCDELTVWWDVSVTSWPVTSWPCDDMTVWRDDPVTSWLVASIVFSPGQVHRLNFWPVFECLLVSRRTQKATGEFCWSLEDGQTMDEKMSWLNFWSDPEHVNVRNLWPRLGPTSPIYTHLLLAGNDTVPISVWRLQLSWVPSICNNFRSSSRKVLFTQWTVIFGTWAV